MNTLPDYPSDVSADDLITELWHNNAKNDGRRHAPDFTVYKIGSTYYAQSSDPTSGDITPSTNALTVLQACVNALDTETGGWIHIKHPSGGSFLATGTLTIDRSFVRITTSSRASGMYTNESGNDIPWITKIVLDAANRKVWGVILEGLGMNELRFFNGTTSSYRVRYVHIIKCCIIAYSTTNKQGVIFDSHGGAGIVDFIYFHGCNFLHKSQASNMGFFTSAASGGDGQGPFFFNHCWYYNYDCPSGVFVRFNVTSLAYIFSQMTLTAHQSNCVMFQTAGANTRVIWTNGEIENGGGGDLTILDIISGSSMQVYASITNTRWQASGGDGGANTYMLDNDATSFASNYHSCFIFTNNFCSGGGYMHAGDTGTGTANWSVIIENNGGFKTKSNGSATIGNGTANVTVTHGLGNRSGGFTPTCVRVTGTTADTASLYVDTVGTTTFRIVAADGVVGGDRTVYWEAYYQA